MFPANHLHQLRSFMLIYSCMGVLMISQSLWIKFLLHFNRQRLWAWDWRAEKGQESSSVSSKCQPSATRCITGSYISPFSPHDRLYSVRLVTMVKRDMCFYLLHIYSTIVSLWYFLVSSYWVGRNFAILLPHSPMFDSTSETISACHW